MRGSKNSPLSFSIMLIIAHRGEKSKKNLCDAEIKCLPGAERIKAAVIRFFVNKKSNVTNREAKARLCPSDAQKKGENVLTY